MKKKIIKIIVLIVVLILIVLLCLFGISQIIKNKYKKILVDNDSLNHEVIQSVDGIVEQTTKLRNNILLIEDDENIIWLNKNTNKSIVINKTLKTAIVTEEESVEIASLNETYIKEYFENDDNKFKYLGKENNYALLGFTDKNTGMIRVLYLNLETKLVEKEIIKNELGENIVEYEIKLDSVKKEDVVEPDLTEYKVIKQ